FRGRRRFADAENQINKKGWHAGGNAVAIDAFAFGHHEDRTPTHRYEPTREAAMAVFAKSWRRERECEGRGPWPELKQGISPGSGISFDKSTRVEPRKQALESPRYAAVAVANGIDGELA